jgi:hypothetical protein|tara:strand:- start:4444 stop:4692 length:249 start_codon:yes stop_codon:yes gene_type:complete
MLCVYCEKTIDSDPSSINLGGDYIHGDCHNKYMQELTDAYESDFEIDEPYLSHDELMDYHGYDDGGQYDNDPNPYEGTYSEM